MACVPPSKSVKSDWLPWGVWAFGYGSLQALREALFVSEAGVASCMVSVD